MPDTILAQTNKLAERTTMQGQVVQTPYITYDEFRSSSVADRKVLNEGTNEFLDAQSFHELLSVTSLDKVVRLLGKSETIDRDTFSDGGWAATLQYEGGTFFDYRKHKRGAISLLEFQLHESNWSFKMGRTRLRPGMSIDSLSPAVRRSISEGAYPRGANVDGIGVIHIAVPGTTNGNQVELLQDGKAQITVHVNRAAGTVEVVRFARLGPW